MSDLPKPPIASRATTITLAKVGDSIDGMVFTEGVLRMTGEANRHRLMRYNEQKKTLEMILVLFGEEEMAHSSTG